MSTVQGETLTVCDVPGCSEHSETTTMFRCECPQDVCESHASRCGGCDLVFCADCGGDDLADGLCPPCREYDPRRDHGSLTDQERNPGLR